MDATIASVPLGRKVTVLDARAEPGVRRRLGELGLRGGATVVVASRSTGGGRIVSVAGSRIALDKSTAAAVLVRVEG